MFMCIQILREKIVSKLGFEPEISSFTHWSLTIGSLRYRYQLRNKPSSQTSTQDSQNVCVFQCQPTALLHASGSMLGR